MLIPYWVYINGSRAIGCEDGTFKCCWKGYDIVRYDFSTPSSDLTIKGGLCSLIFTLER